MQESIHRLPQIRDFAAGSYLKWRARYHRAEKLRDRMFVDLQNCLRYGKILLHIGHIAFAHMRGLLSKKDYVVAYGLSFDHERTPNGRLVRRKRTQIRMSGTDSLLRTHPWASAMEEEIFLLGFDWGEAYARGSLDKPESQPSALSYPHEAQEDKDGIRNHFRL